MPTPVAWFMSGLLLCPGLALLMMALRVRLRPGYGRGLRLGIFFMVGFGVCKAVASLLRTSDFGLPHTFAHGIEGISALLGVAMGMVAVLSLPLGLGIPIDLPIPLRWYAWLLPAASASAREHEQNQDEFRPRG